MLITLATPSSILSALTTKPLSRCQQQ